MNYRLRLFVALMFFIPAIGFSQKDTLVKKLDSLSKTETTAEKKNNNTNPSAYNDSTKFTFNNFFVLLGNDFKQQFTYPFHLKKKDWGRIGTFAAVTATLALADEAGSKFFSGLANRNKAVSSTSSFITSFGGVYEVATIVGFGTVGFISKNEKIKATAFLATQSYLTAGAIETILKYLTSRQRPNYIDPQTNENDPTFHGPFYKFKPQTSGLSTNSSFPSGHTTAVFSAATVYALEYRHHPWIPIVSYSFATLVGISRMTENKHWPTDVLVGAALGYLSGKQVVNNYHRYMKIKQPEKPLRPGRQKKGALSFNLQPLEGKLLPGLTYSFY
ncbi:MAG: phosphatase PAP2 family protein [Bacteroidota bacterium]|nr:phosphatase PAP2 family protein [Bacteroidota bacterium]